MLRTGSTGSASIRLYPGTYPAGVDGGLDLQACTVFVCLAGRGIRGT